MSTYELDDDLVRGLVTGHWAVGTTVEKLANVLRPQIPVPVPTKLAAVVRCDVQLTAEDTTVFVRWSASPDDPFPWVQAGRLDATFSDKEIGRVTEVLFEGVDL